MISGRLIVYEDFDPYYHALYIKGLHEVFPRSSIRYSRRDFPSGFAHRLGFILDGDPPCKVFVCHSDYSRYDLPAFRWSDVYAKINIDPDEPTPDPAPRIVPLGPSFGVRIYPAVRAFFGAVKSFRLSDVDPREHFANYYRQWRYRLPESAYAPEPSDPDYGFFAGSLWPSDPATNAARAHFVAAGRAISGLHFEGGFAPRRTGGENGQPGYDDLMMTRPYSLSEYVAKTKRSVVVFNTPAVGGCLGWKLGEFLALGKAIISTPLFRVLPAPLVHGSHVHYVDANQHAIEDAIRLIRRDHGYRQRLERGARQYYEDYLRPSAVIQRLWAAAAMGSEERHQ